MIQLSSLIELEKSSNIKENDLDELINESVK